MLWNQCLTLPEDSDELEAPGPRGLQGKPALPRGEAFSCLPPGLPRPDAAASACPASAGHASTAAPTRGQRGPAWTCGCQTPESAPNPTPHGAPVGSGLSDAGAPRSLGWWVVRGLEGQPRGTHRPGGAPRPAPPPCLSRLACLLHSGREG